MVENALVEFIWLQVNNDGQFFKFNVRSTTNIYVTHKATGNNNFLLLIAHEQPVSAVHMVYIYT